jgi:hypothetical protein
MSLIVFALAMLILVFYSGMTIYSLLRFGESRIVGGIVSLCYLLIVLVLVFHAVANLYQI